MKSWGNYPNVKSTHVHTPEWVDQIQLTSPCLPHGNGRSYGDVCLNENGTLLCTRRLNRFLNFDKKNGILTAETGVSLQEILNLTTPFGWTLPVVPGTQFVTLGGAIANDIHGKNHRHAGTFGRHLLNFNLVRSDGHIDCSPEKNQDLFRATIGGLGLTGLITQATLQLKSIPSAFLKIEKIPFYNLEEFFKLDKDSEDHEYTVAWLDCQSQFGRGIYMRGDFCDSNLSFKSRKPITIPFNFPSFVLNRHSIKLFNQIYFYNNKCDRGTQMMHYIPFFFPLDRLYNWNRIYGKRGFLQYQCVISKEFAQTGFSNFLRTIVHSGLGSFLSVLKTFGPISSPGLLYFPKEGISLALDFPNHQNTHHLFKKLDELIIQYNGRIYPAKDACMNASAFKQFYPNWHNFETFIDHSFSSSFWRRVNS